MNHKHQASDTPSTIEGQFEAPTLQVIGPAATVIQGFFGVGWDGPFGMTSPDFEFESDDELE